MEGDFLKVMMHFNDRFDRYEADSKNRHDCHAKQLNALSAAISSAQSHPTPCTFLLSAFPDRDDSGRKLSEQEMMSGHKAHHTEKIDSSKEYGDAIKHIKRYGGTAILVLVAQWIGPVVWDVMKHLPK